MRRRVARMLRAEGVDVRKKLLEATEKALDALRAIASAYENAVCNDAVKMARLVEVAKDLFEIVFEREVVVHVHLQRVEASPPPYFYTTSRAVMVPLVALILRKVKAGEFWDVTTLHIEVSARGEKVDVYFASGKTPMLVLRLAMKMKVIPGGMVNADMELSAVKEHFASKYLAVYDVEELTGRFAPVCGADFGRVFSSELVYLALLRFLAEDSRAAEKIASRIAEEVLRVLLKRDESGGIVEELEKSISEAINALLVLVDREKALRVLKRRRGERDLYELAKVGHNILITQLILLQRMIMSVVGALYMLFAISGADGRGAARVQVKKWARKCLDSLDNFYVSGTLYRCVADVLPQCGAHEVEDALAPYPYYPDGYIRAFILWLPEERREELVAVLRLINDGVCLLADTAREVIYGSELNSEAVENVARLIEDIRKVVEEDAAVCVAGTAAPREGGVHLVTSLATCLCALIDYVFARFLAYFDLRFKPP